MLQILIQLLRGTFRLPTLNLYGFEWPSAVLSPILRDVVVAQTLNLYCFEWPSAVLSPRGRTLYLLCYTFSFNYCAGPSGPPTLNLYCWSGPVPS